MKKLMNVHKKTVSKSVIKQVSFLFFYFPVPISPIRNILIIPSLIFAYKAMSTKFIRVIPKGCFKSEFAAELKFANSISISLRSRENCGGPSSHLYKTLFRICLQSQ